MSELTQQKQSNEQLTDSLEERNTKLDSMESKNRELARELETITEEMDQKDSLFTKEINEIKVVSENMKHKINEYEENIEELEEKELKLETIEEHLDKIVRKYNEGRNLMRVDLLTNRKKGGAGFGVCRKFVGRLDGQGGGGQRRPEPLEAGDQSDERVRE